MKVRREYVKEHLGTGEVEIDHKPTGYMVADILTKALGGGDNFTTLQRPCLASIATLHIQTTGV
jgi:hypothetical protein